MRWRGGSANTRGRLNSRFHFNHLVPAALHRFSFNRSSPLMASGELVKPETSPGELGEERWYWLIDRDWASNLHDVPYNCGDNRGDNAMKRGAIGSSPSSDGS
ncbi:hypothetical protein Nepgr_015264 [Nepenthes gracilis]|uniref:Uncharacterized protein n=1 Tax=Nepenthes gracilis TaxID=150966 RepID=A0AAD3XQK4_NEPGR|nr:hypothetical protein Nepgr_015264 [Nepenthes gracilis]